MIATTRGVLLRGTIAEDAQGNEIEDNGAGAEVGEPFPLSILERDRVEFDAASNQSRTVRVLVGRVPANVPIDEGDRIRDLRDGAIYAVDEFRRTPRGLAGRSSCTLDLRRTTP